MYFQAHQVFPNYVVCNLPRYNWQRRRHPRPQPISTRSIEALRTRRIQRGQLSSKPLECTPWRQRRRLGDLRGLLWWRVRQAAGICHSPGGVAGDAAGAGAGAVIGGGGDGARAKAMTTSAARPRPQTWLVTLQGWRSIGDAGDVDVDVG